MQCRMPRIAAFIATDKQVKLEIIMRTLNASHGSPMGVSANLLNGTNQVQIDATKTSLSGEYIRGNLSD